MANHGYRPKYRNAKVEYQGMTFDSKHELKRYTQLQDMQEVGLISDLKRQAKFTLIPSQYVDGRCVERPCSYIADFTYMQNGELIVEDTKSKATRTKDYVIKRKLMLYLFGIRIREIG